MKPESASRSAVIIAALVLLSGCASTRIESPEHLRRDLAAADVAYRELEPNQTKAYNTALTSIVRDVDRATPALLETQLTRAGVTLDAPAVKLSLIRYHAVRASPRLTLSTAVGVPVVLECDTSPAPIYPRAGLFLAATAVYRRVQNRPHLSFVTADTKVTLGPNSYPLVTDKNAAASLLARRSHRVAHSGLTNLLHPEVREKGRIVLSQPYDPNKIPILLVHGLQTTPFTFLQLVNALESEPEIARRYQFWHYYYSTGTPVLLNALKLREELERTVRMVDPDDADFATHHIVALGHSMGGLLVHTLVSSSGDRLWKSLFVVPPGQLRGDRETAQRLERAFFFRRNPRIVRAIFISTPHHGSAMADSWFGALGKSLIRLPDQLQHGLTNIAEENREVRTAEAAAFFKELNFTSVHMLSPRDPMLLALARLPIGVPFHSIMGEKHNGSGSDGVVRYASSHLDGANSELIVRSGHNAFNNPEARSEVIRVLREELQRSSVPRRASASMLAGYPEKRNIVFPKSAARPEEF